MLVTDPGGDAEIGGIEGEETLDVGEHEGRLLVGCVACDKYTIA